MTMTLPTHTSSASDLNVSAHPELPIFPGKLLLLLLSRFSRARLCAPP